ncbi:hypothetical protein GF378_00905 [Candidatus Pacearchaeota archaeon]|nr:hypothetical protein [Candidatus Pacearchaeota archaeon]
MAKENENTLEKLKKNYSKLQKQHDLPGFDDMNKDFYIEKLSDTETDLLMREIRKVVADRLFSYLRFLENLINPQNAPVWIYSVIKALDPEDKTKVESIYKKLSSNEINLIELDVSFNEEKEVMFVKKSYDLWQKIKKEMLEVISSIKKNINREKGKSSKGYFG